MPPSRVPLTSARVGVEDVRGDLPLSPRLLPDLHVVAGDRGRLARGEHIRAFLASMHETWSNLEIVAEHVVAEGEWVMGRCTSSAIHSTTVMGVAPTNRRIETTFWDLHRFNHDGLIVETWNVVDGLAIMQQLKAS